MKGTKTKKKQTKRKWTKKCKRYLYGVLIFSFAFFSLRFRFSRTQGRRRGTKKRDEDDVNEEISKVSVWID